MKYLALDTNILISLCLADNKTITPKERTGIKKLLDSKSLRLILPKVVQSEFEMAVKREFYNAKEHYKTFKNDLKNLVIPSSNDRTGSNFRELKDKMLTIAYKINTLFDDFDLTTFRQPLEYIIHHDQTKIIDYDIDIFFNSYKRIVEKKAPSHVNDQLNDGIIIESIIKHFTMNPIGEKDIAYFISFDLSGFAGDDKESLHPDLKDKLDSLKLKYSPFLGKVLKEYYEIDEINDKDIADEKKMLDKYTPHKELYKIPDDLIDKSRMPYYQDLFFVNYPDVSASLSGSSTTWRPLFYNSALDTNAV